MSCRTALFFVFIFLLALQFYFNCKYFAHRYKIIVQSTNHMLPPPMQVKHRGSKDISCNLLIAGDKKEIMRAEQLRNKHDLSNLYRRGGLRNSAILQHRASDQSKKLLALTQNCSSYISSRGFINSTVDVTEALFPLAFSLVVYRDAQQVERLLRAVWRPHNHYCIHVDVKSGAVFRRVIEGVAHCFNNVYIHPDPVSVVWGRMSVLKAELLCMELLLKKSQTWRYFLNLTGQEFPLKTNYELYLILKALNGSNEIFGGYRRSTKSRYKNAPTPPHGIRPMKGPVHIAATRSFVQYALQAAPSKGLLEWLRHTRVPDETFFATLNYNPHLKVPGAYTGYIRQGVNWSGIARYKIWYNKQRCAGKFVRGICVFSVGDLPRLTSAEHMFANKFMYNYDSLVYDCLEEWYFHKVERERQGEVTLKTSVYNSRWLVKHHFP